MQIYILRDNQQTGPFTEAEIRAQLAAGTITPETMAWWDGLPEWKPLSDTPLTTPPAAAPAVTPATLTPPPVFTSDPAEMGAKTSGLAIGSLVCGVVGIFCAIILGPAAVIMGHIARSQIKKDPTLKGSGMALAGLILGYVWIVFFIAYMIFIVTEGPKLQQALQKLQQQAAAQQNGDTNNVPAPAPAPAPETPPATPPPAAPDNQPAPAPAPATPPATSPSQ
jgi:Domain of unknown function (DUF4190)/GYF domain 2